MNPNSFFLMYRKIFNHEVWKSPVDFRLFFLIVGNAVFKEEGVEINGIHVKRGQWLRSYRNLQKDLEFKEKRGYKQYGIATIKRSVDRLIKNELVTVSETDSGTLFEVVNYEKYQGFGEIQEPDSGTLTGTKSERNRNKNNKVTMKNKDEKNIKALRSKLKFETHHMELAQLLNKMIRENTPHFKEPNLESWANTIRLMMERENRQWNDIQDLIYWCQQHHFWYRNILSADKLRKQFDRLWLEMNDEHRFKVIKGGRQNEADKRTLEGEEQSAPKYDFSQRNRL